MKILVVGAGAVGSWLGGTLAASGAQVTLVERAAYSAQIRAQGVRVEGRVPIVVHPEVVATVAEAVPAARNAGEAYDVVFVTVKSYDAASVAADLEGVGSPPRVVCLQNGVGVVAEFERLVSDALIIPATLTIAVHLRGPGDVVAWKKGGVGIGAPPHGPDTSDIADLMGATGLEVRLYEDGAAMKWSKLLLNMIGAASSASIGWPPPRILRDRRLFEIERAAWIEAVATIRSSGHDVVALPGYRVDWFAAVATRLPSPLLFQFAHRSVGRERGDRLPGVAMDMELGRTSTEVTYLNGAVARAGRACGKPAPVNEALCAIVEDIATGKLDRAAFWGNPDGLVGALTERGVTPWR